MWTLEGGRGRPESANGDAGVTAGDAEHSWEFAAEPGSSTWSPCGPEGGAQGELQEGGSFYDLGQLSSLKPIWTVGKETQVKALVR